MERKSMGSFIAALRKAKGLTQKDLAEKLNLSDRTVSRWERDENAPDLSLIPVLAEIFEVTCDELLCGERKIKQESGEGDSPRKIKQLKRILDDGIYTFENRSYIAMAIIAVGVIAGLIANFGFTEAQIGFFISLVFFVAGGLCQCISSNGATHRMDSDEFEVEQLQPYRKKQFDGNVRTVLWLCVALGMMAPLLLVNAHLGIAASSYIPCAGIVIGAIGLVYQILVRGFLTKIALQRGIYVENAALLKAQRLQKAKNRGVAVTAVGCALTLLVQILYFGTCSGRTFANYESFTNLDDFVAYMELEREREPVYGDSSMPVAPDQVVGEPTYYDQYGNVITEEEARRETIRNGDGTVLCTYQDNNQEVVGHSIYWSGDELTEIRTYTAKESQAGWDIYNYYGNLLNIGYPISLGLGLVYYLVVRKKYL